MAGENLEIYIGAQIPELATALQTKLKQERNVDIGYNDLTYWLSDFALEFNEQNLQLSRTKPDFEQIKQQMISRLRQKDSWRDLIQAGVGETLLEFVAAVGDYGQTSILRAYQETSYDARLTSSVYTITRALGVHIDRKVPAKVNVNLYGQEADDLAGTSIPSFSQFQVNGIPFFNRETITFDNNTVTNPKQVTLYQGQVVVEVFMSYGTPFQTVEIGANDYRVADADVYCFLDEQDQYKRITDGLWHYKETDKVFYEQTTPNGNVEILFGNGVYGKTPEIDRTITFIYALTNGADANTTQINQTIELVELNSSVPDRIKHTDPAYVAAISQKVINNLQGVSVSAIFNGGDEKSKDFYAAVAPGIRASGNRAVTRPDHYALGLNFPNVADVLFQGQKELERYNRNYINVVGVTVLTESGVPFTDDQWADYLEYLNSIEIARVNFVRIDPVPVPIDVSGDVYCMRNTDITNVQPFLHYNFVDYFKIQRGSLGKSVYQNDIDNLMKFDYGNMHVDYAVNVKPSIDYILKRTQYPVLGSFNVNIKYSDRSYKAVQPRIL